MSARMNVWPFWQRCKRCSTINLCWRRRTRQQRRKDEDRQHTKSYNSIGDIYLTTAEEILKTHFGPPKRSCWKPSDSTQIGWKPAGDFVFPPLPLSQRKFYWTCRESEHIILLQRKTSGRGIP